MKNILVLMAEIPGFDEFLKRQQSSATYFVASCGGSSERDKTHAINMLIAYGYADGINSGKRQMRSSMHDASLKLNDQIIEFRASLDEAIK